jgi:uncharacterized heparinase superfamily protein
MKLVHNWRRAWRWFSVQALAVSATAPAAWLAVPDDMRAAVPAEWLAAAGIALGVMGLVGRLMDQGDG